MHQEAPLDSTNQPWLPETSFSSSSSLQWAFDYELDEDEADDSGFGCAASSTSNG
jgi:hypothetical protein